MATILDYSTIAIQFIVQIISAGGYLGIFILMALESMAAPVPSELVMPFIGFLVVDGKLDLLIVIAVTSLASLTGSLISYYIAYFGEIEIVHHFGKFFFIDKEHLRMTSEWFKKHGSVTVLVSRFIPVVRHLISLPAGFGRMDLKKFITYTLIGATAWNVFLLWIGMQLRERWEVIHNYSRQFDIVVIVVLVLAVAFYAYMRIKKSKKA
ncbi:MAG: DedA family protein [Candidatus Aenigmatarchaeota archaeon]